MTNSKINMSYAKTDKICSQNLEAQLINNNIISVFNAFGAKNISIGEDKYNLLKTGYSDIYFNLVLLPQLSSLKNIEKISQDLKKQNLPFCWWVDESTAPNGLFKYFEENNYTFYTDALGMYLDLTNYQPKTHTNNKIKISIANDLNSFKECIRLLGEVFHLSEESHKLYIDNYGKFITIGAYYDGKLVSTGSIFMQGDVAGLHNGATLEPYRRQGISSALYDFRLQLMQKLGIKKAVLHAFPMTISIAEKFGFQPIVNYKLYVHGHDRNSSGP